MKLIHIRRRTLLPLVVWFLFLFWFLIGPWPRRWAESDLFHVTSPAPLSNRSPITPTTGPLTAGVATVDLTKRFAESLKPAELRRLPLAGYGKRALLEGNAGQASPLKVKALLLDNGHDKILLFASDLLLINRILADRVMKRLEERGFSLPRSHVLFSATHTHSSVAGYPGKLFESVSLGLHDPKIAHILADAFADAAMSASQTRVAAEWQAIATELPHDRVVNRTMPEGPTHTWLDLIQFRRATDQTPLATLLFFSAHATCDSSKGTNLSADYPGILTEEISKRRGGETLFVAGAVGGMGPGEIDASRETRALRYGKKLAQQTLGALATRGSFERAITLGAVAMETTLPAPQIKLPGDWRLSPIASSTLGPRQAFLQSIRLGDRLLLATPADFGGEIALPLRHHHPGLTTIVTSFNGDYVGYILPDTHYDAPSYEPRSMVLLGSAAGQFFTDSLLDLARPLTRLPIARKLR